MFLRSLFIILISILTGFVVYINICLLTPDETIDQKKADIRLQLNFLKTELKDNNLGIRMQNIFPEGYVFVNSLYGLSWCELANVDKHNLDNQILALNEALFAYDQVDSDQARFMFEETLNPEFGIFYYGWRNYLLSKVLKIDTSFINHEKYIREFKFHCQLIEKAITESKTPFLQSYESQAWPADMFVAVASLANYDMLFPSIYKKAIALWIEKVKEKLDPQTGMIPHKVDPVSGNIIEGPRGCSMSLILRMLFEIDPEFAKEQFKLFQKNFISTTLGLPSIREYPSGKIGFGDIDSGPVVLGVGFSATIDMIGTLSQYGLIETDEKLYKTISAFGLVIKKQKEKKYLLGKMPMADAFIAWGRSTGLSVSQNSSKEWSENWRLKFQLFSGVLLCSIWLLLYRKKIFIKKKRLSNKS